MVTINIAKEFTDAPGARNKSDGPYSGEEFRESFLESHFSKLQEKYKVKIILDGTEGFATSFLEEAFGGLARKYSKEVCRNRLEFVSQEDPLLVQEIMDYIEKSDE